MKNSFVFQRFFDPLPSSSKANKLPLLILKLIFCIYIYIYIDSWWRRSISRMAELSSHPPIEIPRGRGRGCARIWNKCFHGWRFIVCETIGGGFPWILARANLPVRTTPRRPVTDSTPRASSPLAAILEWLKATDSNDHSTYLNGHAAS